MSASQAGGTLLVVSSHCDDGVLGCGDLIHANPGARVVSVFPGVPADSVAGRSLDDRDVLTALAHETPRWKPSFDGQDALAPAAGVLARDLAALLLAADPVCVALPLGLFHSDHALVHEAALRVLRADPARRTRTWVAYADTLYRRLPGLVAARLAALVECGVRTTPWTGPVGPASLAKRRAIARHASPLRALASPGRPGAENALLPERYWRLTLAADDRAGRRGGG